MYKYYQAVLAALCKETFSVLVLAAALYTEAEEYKYYQTSCPLRPGFGDGQRATVRVPMMRWPEHASRLHKGDGQPIKELAFKDNF